MAFSCVRGGSGWILGKISYQKQWKCNGTDAQGVVVSVPGGV